MPIGREADGTQPPRKDACHVIQPRKVRLDFNAVITPFSAEEIAAHTNDTLVKYIGTDAEVRPPRNEDGAPIGLSPKHASLYWVDYETGSARRSVILYLKASMTGDEEGDVRAYHSSHPEFPHEATGDQIFNEPQWESYRKLGEHIATPLLQDPDWFWRIPLGNSPEMSSPFVQAGCASEGVSG